MRQWAALLEMYHVGSLVYIRAALLAVMFRMLLGDLGLQNMEQLPTSLVRGNCACSSAWAACQRLVNAQPKLARMLPPQSTDHSIGVIHAVSDVLEAVMKENNSNPSVWLGSPDARIFKVSLLV